MNWSVVMFGVPESTPATGGEKYLLEVYQALQRSGIPVHNIDISESPRWMRRCPLPLNVLLSNFWFIACLRSLKLDGRVVLFEDFHFHPRLFVLNLLTGLFGKRNIVVLFQLSLYYHSILRWRIMRWLDEHIIRLVFRQADLIFSNSISGRDAVLSLGVPAGKVEVVHCGYDDLRAHGNGPSARVIGERASQILFVGRISPNKGLEYLLEAFALLGRDDLVLNLVGDPEDDPEYYRYLRKIVTRHDMERQVLFHGFVGSRDQLRVFYEKADVFVLPSLTEGFGIVLLEAMSMGLPVVATNIGAIPEHVKHEETGILVPPKDASALAEALALLLDSPSLRQQYSLNARRYCEEVRAKYSWESVTRRILASLSEVAAASGA